MPSLILYKCPQFAHSSDPSLICVSKRSVCKSCRSFGSASSSSGVGAEGGRAGNPSFELLDLFLGAEWEEDIPRMQWSPRRASPRATGC